MWLWLSYEELFLKASKKKKKSAICIQINQFIIFAYLHVNLFCLLKDGNWLRRT